MKRSAMCKAVAAIIMILSVFMRPPNAHASPSTAEAVGAEILAQLGRYTAAVRRGGDTAALTRMIYAEEILLVQDGADSPALRGIDAVISYADQALKSAPPGTFDNCSYMMIDPILHSGKLFASFLQFTCKQPAGSAAPDLNLRALYVWQKKKNGWRVVLETVVGGRF